MQIFQQFLLNNDFSQADLEDVHRRVAAEIDEAVTAVATAPDPDPESFEPCAYA